MAASALKKNATDEDAVAAQIDDYHHLPQFMLPQGIKLEQQDYEIESIREVMDA